MKHHTHREDLGHSDQVNATMIMTPHNLTYNLGILETLYNLYTERNG